MKMITKYNLFLEQRFTKVNRPEKDEKIYNLDSKTLYVLIMSVFKNTTFVREQQKPLSKNKITTSYTYPETTSDLIGGDKFYEKGIIGEFYKELYLKETDSLDMRIKVKMKDKKIRIPKLEDFIDIAFKTIQMNFSSLTDNNTFDTILHLTTDKSLHEYFYIDPKGNAPGIGSDYFLNIPVQDFFKYILKDDIYKYCYLDVNNEKIVNLINKTITKGDKYINIDNDGNILLNAPISPMSFDITNIEDLEDNMRPGSYRTLMAAFNKLPKEKKQKVRKLLGNRSYKIGRKVYHQIYGEGEIVDKNQTILTIKFDNEVKKFAIDKVKLYEI